MKRPQPKKKYPHGYDGVYLPALEEYCDYLENERAEYMGIADTVILDLKDKLENSMKWIPINPDNLPQGEVLAGNFQKGTFGYLEKIVGILYKDEYEEIACSAEDTILENCTHYIDINKYDL